MRQEIGACYTKSSRSDTLLNVSSDWEAVSASADFDLAIIGAGMAGISLALELELDPKKVVLIESGLDRPSPSLNSLKAVVSEGIEIKEDSRERVFGGTSSTWSGALAVLDEVDLGGVDGVHEGWPIDLSEVLHEFAASSARFGMPPLGDFEPSSQVQSLLGSGNLSPKIIRIQNPPMRFGDQFREELSSKGFTIRRGETATSLHKVHNENAELLWTVKLCASGKPAQEIRAKKVVLAAGAIETVRLLLATSEHDDELRSLPALGKYFMNHPKGEIGRVHFKKRIMDNHPFFHLGDGGFPGVTGIRLSSDTIRQQKTSNPYVRLVPIYSRPVLFVRRIALGLASFIRRSSRLNSRGRRMEVADNGEGSYSNEVSRPVFAHQGPKRLSFPVQSASLAVHTDMMPRAENSIRLSGQLDEFGVPLPIVEHQFSSVDIDSVRCLVDLVRDEFERSRVGKVVSHLDQIVERLQRDASHHLGGARMGNSRLDSVVNLNLEVHQSPGLYVLGGAVFPTGGNANPTLVILALARRLAKHLSSIDS